MFKNKKILSIILARGGSKGLPNKNIRMLCGKPLVQHTIDHCLNSEYIDKTIVSTDCNLIKLACQNFCEVIDRPSELATDLSRSEDSLFHAISLLEKRGEHFDIIVFPQVTHPIRRPELVDICLEYMDKKGADSLFTSKSFSPFFAHKNNGKIVFNERSKIFNRKMRQEYKSDLFFYDIGNIFIFEQEMFCKRLDRIGFNPTMFVLKDEECIDIHSELDLKITELIKTEMGI
jgi:CMP-N,N'-diacetyllegionaminic acid synthase